MLFRKVIPMMFLLLTVFVFSSNSFAQNMPADKAGRSADMLYKQLNLTTDQYNKVYTSMLEYYTKNATNDDTKNWEATKSSIGNILNKDQMLVYSSMRDKSIMSPVMRRHHKRMNKSSETSSKDMNKETTKNMDDTKKDATKKMEDTKKDVMKKKDDKMKEEKKSTDKK